MSVYEMCKEKGDTIISRPVNYNEWKQYWTADIVESVTFEIWKRSSIKLPPTRVSHQWTLSIIHYIPAHTLFDNRKPRVLLKIT